MRNIKRNAAVIAAGAVIASVGIGGVMTAQADNTPAHQSPANLSVQNSGADEAEETSDGPDQGADANPNEPGHQDANESGEADGPDGAEGPEGDEAEETSDGPDQGADANPNEPGHQDADENGEAGAGS